MRPIQLFRAVLKSFSDGKTFNPNYFMARIEQEGVEALPPPPANFHASSEVVFVEPSGWLNIAAHLTRSGLVQVLCPLDKFSSLCILASFCLEGSLGNVESFFMAAFLDCSMGEK